VQSGQASGLLACQPGGRVRKNIAYKDSCFFNACTPSLRRCCYITVDSSTTALQNGACPYHCISKQMHYKTPFSHNGHMKSLEFFEKYITQFYLEKNNLFEILY
jgi:hypothetical protein